MLSSRLPVNTHSRYSILGKKQEDCVLGVFLSEAVQMANPAFAVERRRRIIAL